MNFENASHSVISVIYSKFSVLAELYNRHNICEIYFIANNQSTYYFPPQGGDFIYKPRPQ